MLILQPKPDHEDGRGTITDLAAQPLDAVTRVRTNAGAVRGNHLHNLTKQWTFVVSGKLRITTGEQEVVAGPGDLIVNPPGEPHAWEALEDTDCIVFAKGPRAGHDYELDTLRLKDPLIVA